MTITEVSYASLDTPVLERKLVAAQGACDHYYGILERALDEERSDKWWHAMDNRISETENRIKLMRDVLAWRKTHPKQYV